MFILPLWQFWLHNLSPIFISCFVSIVHSLYYQTSFLCSLMYYSSFNSRSPLIFVICYCLKFQSAVFKSAFEMEIQMYIFFILKDWWNKGYSKYLWNFIKMAILLFYSTCLWVSLPLIQEAGFSYPSTRCDLLQVLLVRFF